MKRNYLSLAAILSLAALSSCSIGGAESSSPKEQGTSDVSINIDASEEESRLDVDEDIYEIYKLYRSNGGTLTYEDWLASIKGEKGDKGDQGEKGEDGSSVLTGKGEPSSSLGKDGDSYIDTDTFDYYSKSNGSWTKQGNLKGSDGKDGSDGIDGKDGADGKDGIDGKDGESAITYVPCIFNNWDGTKLYEFYFEKGSSAVYDGITPTKEDTVIDGHTAHWTFKGWDKSLDNITKPTIFTAQYESLVNVTFKNYGGSVLETSSVTFGETPTYNGETPTRPSEVDGSTTIEWTFKGWDKKLSSVYEDTVYTAVFDSPNAIKCTFVNEDGTELGISYCGVGGKAVYNGETPTKEEVNNEGTITRYTFKGWDKAVTNMQTSTTFVAQYEESAWYVCKFLDYDGTLLKKVVVPQNGSASFDSTPHRDPVADGDNVTEYTFDSWDKTTSGITAPTSFTANYISNAYEGYLVTFNGVDDTKLRTEAVAKGGTVVYSGNISDLVDAYYSYDSENVTMFAGWNDSLENITSAKTVTAVTKTLSRHQNGEYPQTSVTWPANLSELSPMPAKDSQGYYEYRGEKYYPEGNGTARKVEPIKWRYLRTLDDGIAEFMSERVLTSRQWNSITSDYDDGAHANNYAKSDIRSWLNGDFFEQAFYYDQSLVQTVVVDNSPVTTGESTNEYACQNTNDKIYLPSVADVTNSTYGFLTNRSQDKNRIACDADKNIHYWWTRSPDSFKAELITAVDSYGGVWFTAFGNNYNGIRPCVQLKIS